MRSTSAAQTIIQALCAGPGPEIFEVVCPFTASAPCAELFTYASRSATRCSSDGEAAAEDVDVCADESCPRAENKQKKETRINRPAFTRSVYRAVGRRSSRKTPPSGWPGQVKVLGGVSLPQQNCPRITKQLLRPLPSTGCRHHLHRRYRPTRLHRNRLAARLPANRVAVIFRNARELLPVFYRDPLLFRLDR